MNLFEKYLSIWVGISILMGIILGNSLPSLFTTIASFELHNVNFVIAVLIWAMIFPMLLNVDFSCMRNVKNNINGIYLTVFHLWNWVNCAVFGIALRQPSYGRENIK